MDKIEEEKQSYYVIQDKDKQEQKVISKKSMDDTDLLVNVFNQIVIIYLYIYYIQSPLNKIKKDIVPYSPADNIPASLINSIQKVTCEKVEETPQVKTHMIICSLE